MTENYRPEIDGARTVEEAIALLRWHAEKQEVIADSHRLHLDSITARGGWSKEDICNAHVCWADHDRAAKTYRVAAVMVEMALDKEREAVAAAS